MPQIMSFLLLVLAIIAIHHSVEAAGTGPGSGPAYSNAEALKRGLPLLKPRLSSRTDSAFRKRASAIMTQRVLNFDDLPNGAGIPLVPAGYQGFSWSSAHYYTTDGPYRPQSTPNALFYASDFSGYNTPTFSLSSGLIRIQSLYCRRGRDDTLTQNLLMMGKLNGATVYTETINCGTCIDCQDPPVLNTFSNLPLVDTVTFAASGAQRSSGMVDNISLTVVA